MRLAIDPPTVDKEEEEEEEEIKIKLIKDYKFVVVVFLVTI